MFIIQYIIIGRKGVREKVLKIDEAFAPKVLRFDGGFAAEGCGGGWRRSIKGARLAPQVGADCVGRLCRRGLEKGSKGSKGSEGSKGKVSPLRGDEYEVSVTGPPSRLHLRAFCIECASRPKPSLSLHIKGPSFYLADRLF